MSSSPSPIEPVHPGDPNFRKIPCPLVGWLTQDERRISHFGHIKTWRRQLGLRRLLLLLLLLLAAAKPAAGHNCGSRNNNGHARALARSRELSGPTSIVA